jgi:site-specific DNA-methyltransferase (adenine-specific)
VSEYALLEGDCVERLRELPDNSVDAVVCDPPYDLTANKKGGSGPASVNLKGFMGKGWDGTGIAFKPETWCEVLRVLKPGGYLLAFGGTRTYHRLACAVEDAGFEVRDSIHWLYGVGFPKSLDVSKAIDKAAGAKREVVGQVVRPDGTTRNKENWTPGTAYTYAQDSWTESNAARGRSHETVPATDAAKKWEGWGTALKPAHEPVVVARKPLSESTVAANVLEHGTGAINVDGCRVAGPKPLRGNEHGDAGIFGMGSRHPAGTGDGRWPPNLVLTHSADCKRVGTRRVKSSTLLTKHELRESENLAMSGKNYARNPRQDYAPDGTEEVSDWRCAEGCPVAELDRQSGTLHTHAGNWKGHGGRGNRVSYSPFPGRPGTYDPGDSGGASRFFPCFEAEPPFMYCAKASRAERELGVRKEDGVRAGNTHPT